MNDISTEKRKKQPEGHFTVLCQQIWMQLSKTMINL